MARHSDDALIKLAIFSMFFGGGLIIKGFRRFQKSRKSEDTPCSKIASAPQGFVEIQGYAWPLTQAVAKSTGGRDLVYLNLQVQKHVKSGKTSYWKTIAEHVTPEPFYVVDESGAALVIPDKFDLEIESQTSLWKKFSLQQRQSLIEFVRAFAHELPPLEIGFFSGSYRCVEKFILVGSPLLLHGNFRSPQDMTQDIRSHALSAFQEQIKKINASSSRRKMMFDLNQDGDVSDTETRIGFASAAAAISRKKAEGEVKSTRVHGLLETHTSERSFFADCHQDFLLKRIGPWNLFLILGGAALLILGVKFLQMEFQFL